MINGQVLFAIIGRAGIKTYFFPLKKYMSPSVHCMAASMPRGIPLQYSEIFRGKPGTIVLVSTLNSQKNSSCKSRYHLYYQRKRKRSDSVLKSSTPAEMSKGQRHNTNNATKSSITQRLRTDLGRSNKYQFEFKFQMNTLTWTCAFKECNYFGWISRHICGIHQIWAAIIQIWAVHTQKWKRCIIKPWPN